jgi:hypothetical protein
MSRMRLRLPSTHSTEPADIYNVVDDHPAPMREWLPYFAGVIGAKPARTVPEMVGAPDRRLSDHRLGNVVPRSIEREGMGWARLRAPVPQVARRLPGRARSRLSARGPIPMVTLALLARKAGYGPSTEGGLELWFAGSPFGRRQISVSVGVLPTTCGGPCAHQPI